MPHLRSVPRPPIRPARELAAELREQADEFTAGPRDPDADAQPESRRSRRLLWWDGLVSNFSESFVINFTNPFALALGATTGQIGWLSAFTNLASALALFPGARLVERTGQRKRIVVVSGGGIARLLLLMMALVPLFTRGTAAIYGLIALVTLRAFFNQLAFPAWSSMLADLVPTGIRGRYFAARNIGLAVAALIAAPLAGWLAERLGLPTGYQVSFFLAGLVGFGATAIFARIPDRPLPPASHATTEKSEGVRSILRTHPRFAGFTAVAFLWNLSLMIAGPFFSVYLVKDLGASPTQIGLLAAIFSVTNIAGQRIWGRLNDRRGAAWVMRITGFMIPGVPLLWSVAPNPWVLLGVEAFSGFVWAGYGLSSFNLLLSLTPAPQRARYTAIYQVSVFSSAFIGPLLGGACAAVLGIRPLFWISAAGRAVAATLFLFTVRGDREST
jgi:MFS family permease